MRVDPAAMKRTPFVDERLNAGMVTSIDPVDIPKGSIMRGKNVRCRYDKLLRRPGSTRVDSGLQVSPVANLFMYQDSDGLRYLVSVHQNGRVQVEHGGAYTLLAASTGISAPYVHYQGASINNRFIMAGDGSIKLKEIDFVGMTMADLSATAPMAKFVTGFYDRTVVANYPSVPQGTIQLGWSAQGVVDEFDPLADETAGFAPLIDSPSDLSDPLMGVLGLENVLVVPREYSLWVGSKQPIPTDPFYFTNAVSGLGTNAPYSIAKIIKGIVFADTRTGNVWMWNPGSIPEALGRMVENELFRSISDPSQLIGSYNATSNEYSLFVPSATPGAAKIWTYNFLTKSWVYDEVQLITAFNDLQYGFASSTFDDLTGTIDEQLGSMNLLGVSAAVVKESRLYGLSSGHILLEDATNETDDGITFESEVWSRQFDLVDKDLYIAENTLEYFARSPCVLTMQYSKDGGLTWKAAKSFQLKLGSPQIAKWKTNIKCRRFMWKFTASAGDFDILANKVYVYPSGLSTK